MQLDLGLNQTAVNGSLMQVREEFRTLLPGNVVTLR
jgi:hypothetical protein